MRDNLDPLAAFCFGLTISTIAENFESLYFKSVSGLKSESEVVSFVEGGINHSTRQLPGPVKWPNLVLKRGFTKGAHGQKLLKWREQWTDPNRSSGKPLQRLNGSVVQLSRDLQVVCRWEFVGGWPAKWEGPDFDASKNELAIETLEIAHEGLIFKAG